MQGAAPSRLGNHPRDGQRVSRFGVDLLGRRQQGFGAHR